MAEKTPKKIAIKICSDFPGTGLSTTVENLVKKLKELGHNVENIISGGKIMRSLAHDWMNKKIPIDEYIKFFEDLIIDEKQLLNYLQEIFIKDTDHSENELAKFHNAIEKSTSLEKTIFDRVIDIFPILQVNEMKFGIAVIDAKIAVILEKLRSILGVKFDEDGSIKIINFLLTVDKEVSSLRVLLRELTNQGKTKLAEEVLRILNNDNPAQALEDSKFKTKISEKLIIIQEQNTTRMERDRERYLQAYGITPEDLRNNVPENNIIDTTNLAPDEIISLIISIINLTLEKDS